MIKNILLSGILCLGLMSPAIAGTITPTDTLPSTSVPAPEAPDSKRLEAALTAIGDRINAELVEKNPNYMHVAVMCAHESQVLGRMGRAEESTASAYDSLNCVEYAEYELEMLNEEMTALWSDEAARSFNFPKNILKNAPCPKFCFPDLTKIVPTIVTPMDNDGMLCIP